MADEKQEKRKSIAWVRILIAVIAVGLVVGGLFLLRQEEPEKYSGPVEKITVAAAEYLTGALVYVAEDQGFFEENGLEVTLKGYGSGKACADALIAGEADISTSAGFVFVSDSFEHTDLKVFGTVATKQVKELVARKDKGITAINDLMGKKIGVTKKSGAEFQLGVFLTFNDISQEDVELVDLRPPEMMGAISNGDVDAVFVWDPYLYNIKNELGENAISWPGGEDFYFVLLTKEDWLEANPAAVERFMKSLLEAEDYIKDNSEEAKEFVRDRFEYESDYMDYGWPKQEYAVTLPQAMLILLEDQARWRIEQGLTDTTEVPNYLGFIYLDALEKVKSEAVTIIH
jgi:NitT/TauT family transport system substrate-binding protein